jgi:competence protein ComEA
VGPSTAKAIITHRTTVAPFSSIDDLLQVNGIGPAKLEAMRAYIAV